jgi:predicted O-methyltransferase YrrM
MSSYQFTADWFALHLPIWRQIFATYSPRRILEVGSFEGRSATYMIEECATLEKLVCADLWEDYPELDMSGAEARFDSNIETARQRRGSPVYFRKMRGKSFLTLAHLLAQREEFDVIYIDGSHLAPDVLTDAVIAFYLLRVGGLMVFDDYLWRDKETGGQDILHVPKVAIDAFVNIFYRKLVVRTFAIPYQVYLEKVAD